MWPHSPAILLRPTWSCRFTTRPPPTPVPKITPKTTRTVAAAPSTASESTRQFASFSMRIGRPNRASRSRSSGLPLRTVLFEFFSSPVDGRDCSGSRDADRSVLAGLLFRKRHQFGHCIHDAGVVSRRRSHAMPQKRGVTPERWPEQSPQSWYPLNQSRFSLTTPRALTTRHSSTSNCNPGTRKRLRFWSARPITVAASAQWGSFRSHREDLEHS